MMLHWCPTTVLQGFDAVADSGAAVLLCVRGGDAVHEGTGIRQKDAGLYILQQASGDVCVGPADRVLVAPAWA